VRSSILCGVANTQHTAHTQVMNPDKTFFVSDTHFGHVAVLKYSNRPWSDRDAMDAGLIEAWNATVPHDGVVYHLGDVSFRKTADTLGILAQLNGRKILVRGNHDSGLAAPCRSMFEAVYDYHEATIEDIKVVMCHYPLESWNKMHYGSFHLHGHSHGNMPAFGRRKDVGVDCIGYKPISWREVRAGLETLKIFSRDHHQPRAALTVDADTKPRVDFSHTEEM
jgi:calcineurin-like phosphoesterase family protein